MSNPPRLPRRPVFRSASRATRWFHGCTDVGDGRRSRSRPAPGGPTDAGGQRSARPDAPVQARTSRHPGTLGSGSVLYEDVDYDGVTAPPPVQFMLYDQSPHESLQRTAIVHRLGDVRVGHLASPRYLSAWVQLWR